MDRCLELPLQVPELVKQGDLPDPGWRRRRHYMHETTERQGTVLLRCGTARRCVNVGETYCENGNLQGRIIAVARLSHDTPIITQPQDVHVPVVLPQPSAISVCNRPLRSVAHGKREAHEPSTNAEAV